MNKITDMVKLDSKKEIDFLNFQWMKVFSSEGKQLVLKEEDFFVFKGEVERAIELSKSFELQTNIHEFLCQQSIKELETMGHLIFKKSMTNPLLFFEPFYYMIILPNGAAGSCLPFCTKREGIDIKNISLEEAWYSPFMNNMRKMFTDGIDENYIDFL